MSGKWKTRRLGCDVSDLHLLSVEEDHLLCEQQFDRHGVPVIEQAQIVAVEAWCVKNDRTWVRTEGGKRTKQVKFYFAPSFEEPPV